MGFRELEFANNIYFANKILFSIKLKQNKNIFFHLDTDKLIISATDS